jgi:uncharacterized protein (DUF2252 family)
MTVPKTAHERYVFGQSQRKHMKRADHAGWQPNSRTADPATLLAASMQGRVPALISIKYDRMASSPFGYFRGAVPVMASDLSVGANTGIFTQLCGDAHIRNLGAFAALDGHLVFDLNDFDETIRGPFEWDVKRLATSIILAGREAGAKHSQCHEAALAFLEHYRSSMQAFAQMPVLELARYTVHRLRTVRPISQILSLAERATPLHNLDALTVPAATVSAKKKAAATSELPPRTHGHARIFKTIEPLLTRVSGDTARNVLDSLATYAETLQPIRQHFLAQYKPIDVAFKIVGTGSVGLRDYCIYLQGIGAKDPLFLQIKEEVASGYSPYLGEAPGSVHQGRRVVDGERAMQLQSDPFLGWTTISCGNSTTTKARSTCRRCTRPACWNTRRFAARRLPVATRVRETQQPSRGTLGLPTPSMKPSFASRSSTQTKPTATGKRWCIRVVAKKQPLNPEAKPRKSMRKRNTLARSTTHARRIR